MWGPLASELGVPWRAAEAMHWQLGEVDMARRAGVIPFSLASAAGSSNLAPVAMLPSGMGGAPYAGEDSRTGSGYFVEGVPPRTSFMGADTLGRLGRRGGLMEPRGPPPTGAAIGIDIGGGEYGGRYSQGAALPSLAELERGVTSSDSGGIGDPPTVSDGRTRRGANSEEERRRGRP